MKVFIAIFGAIALFGCISAQAQDSNVDSIIQLNRHDFVVRGNHANEMEPGDYVIVGSAFTEKDAKLSINQLLKLRYPEAAYGYSTSKSLWYIYYGAYKDIEETRQKRDELRKFKLYKNARLLTVHQ